MRVVSIHPMRPITIVAPTSAPNHRATHATKLGQSIFQGERIYSMNSSSHTDSIASISHSIVSVCLGGSFSIEIFFFVGIFLISVCSCIDFVAIFLECEIIISVSF